MGWWKDKVDLLLGEWNIGFARQKVGDVLNGKPLHIEWLRHGYSDRWFADPFMLAEDASSWYVLVEEMTDSIGRGVITLLTVDKQTVELVSRKVVIQEDCHFSFPYIYNKGVGRYVMPEKGWSGSLDLYAYNADDHSCHKVETQAGLSVSDAILVDSDTMLATQTTAPNGNRLTVFCRGNDGWAPQYDITFADNIARNAGALFIAGNDRYRPAQVCNNSYGEGISIQRLTSNGAHITLEEVRRIMPSDEVYSHGLHTFNVWSDNLIVVDGLKYNSRRMPGRLWNKLSGTLRNK